MAEKRKDLQGIRGVAILAVVAYHFFPEIFQNGYVGVDQFFVLSGFLIAETLTRHPQITGGILISFYYRRFKRILPLYLLCILLIILYLRYVFNSITLAKNVSMAVRSLLLFSNIPLQNAPFGYELQISRAHDSFTHTWSLSAEIQFYVLAPFLILFPLANIRQHIIFIICISSFCLHAYFMNFTSKKTFWTSGSLLTRIWQFAIGILISYWSCDRKMKRNKSNEEIDKSMVALKIDKWAPYISGTLLTVIICTAFCPVKLPAIDLRLVICLITAYIIYAGANNSTSFLSNNILVFFVLCVGAIFSFLLSVFLTKVYEKWYLEQSPKIVIGLTAVLYAACFYLLLANWRSTELINFSNFEPPTNLITENAVEWNIRSKLLEYDSLDLKQCEYTPFVEEEESPWTVCEIQNLSLRGNNRIMLIGNSYAANIARMFISLEECQKAASNIIIYSKVACEVLENTDWFHECLDQPDIFKEAIMKYKPDVLFITTRHLESMKNSTITKYDDIFQKELRYLEEIEELVSKKVYIVNAIPRPVGDVSQQLIARLEAGVMSGQSSLTDTSANYLLARNRMNQLKKVCKKCELIDIMPSLTINGTFQMYDEKTGLQYFADGMHLSDYALYKVAPIYRKICKKYYE